MCSITFVQVSVPHEPYEVYRNTILHQRDVFENYLKHAGRCIYFADSTALKDYGEFYFAALSYAPAELRGDMITANQLMLQDEWEEANLR